ncbi:MAG: anthranilate synthase component I, partial [Rhodospirillaceae bacterium]|nr:anthranilate synthase component I [Rhodospirillaceae bacterium]
MNPDFDSFREGYDSGRGQLVWSALVADLETPVSAMLKLADGRPNSFLFESVEGGETRGRYSFLGMKPDLIWRCRRDRAEINRKARIEPDSFEPCEGHPLDALRALIAESRLEVPPGMPPMASGLFGYMGYDMVRLVEKLPDDNPDELGLPDSIFLRPTVVAIFDGIEDRVTICTPVWPDPAIGARAAYDLACERLADATEDFARSLPYRREAPSGTADLPEPESNMSQQEFEAMVERAKDYIRAGDVFQVVPSQRFRLPFRLPPFALYRALRRLNPSPFLFYMDFGDFTVVGSSPEIMVRSRDGIVTIRPLAGTRKRGATPAEDQALEEELLADPKERAEHLMLLDLGRNDVGRVAKIGTVKVTAQFEIERYSHVMHISSNVEGELDTARHDALGALTAGCPAGT